MVYVARHGETAWTLTGQHTGRTDLPLTKHEERNAQRLQERLRGFTFAKIFYQPVAACHANVLKERPGWQLFRDGCPGGESANDVGVRADRVVKRVREVKADVLVFSYLHSAFPTIGGSGALVRSTSFAADEDCRFRLGASMESDDGRLEPE